MTTLWQKNRNHPEQDKFVKPATNQYTREQVMDEPHNNSTMPPYDFCQTVDQINNVGSQLAQTQIQINAEWQRNDGPNRLYNQNLCGVQNQAGYGGSQNAHLILRINNLTRLGHTW